CGLAPRRARAVRPGDVVAGEPAAPGLLPGTAGHAAARRARHRAGGLEPPAVGAARVHALVRAARRAGTAAARVGADGGARSVKAWIDITAPAHVLVFRPLVEIMRGRGDEVQITARDYAQTLELLELHGLEADEVVGRHAGRSRLQKARQMT